MFQSVLNKKQEIREKFPESFYYVYFIYRNIKVINYYVIRFFDYFLLFIPNIILRKKKIYLFVIPPYSGIGDQLILGPVLLHYSLKGRVLIHSKNEKIFENFPVESLSLKNSFMKKFLFKLLIPSPYSNIIGTYNLGDSPKYFNIGKRKFIREARFSKRKDVLLEIRNLKREAVVKFSETELKKFSKKYSNIIKKDYSIVVPTPLKGGLENVKDWGFENFQKVVIKTKNNNWIQMGGDQNPKGNLDGIFKNLSGKTDIRECFYLVSRAKLILTNEGMFTHLSSAFNIPCITIYSGYHYPEISLYKNIIPITAKEMPPCSYCWISPCKFFDKPKCLTDIFSEEVIQKVKRK